jgi:hypothetical protein
MGTLAPTWDCCLIADANDRRAQFLQAAMARIGGRLVVVSHQQAFDHALPAARHYKLETPAASEADFHWLSEIGAEAPLQPRAHGELVDLRHYQRGLAIYAERLSLVSRRWLVTPTDALLMADKWRCQQHLAALGNSLCTPALLGEIENFDALQARMREQHCHRVFLKTRYGSSASGVLAIRADASFQRWQMISSVEASDGRLYNSLKLRFDIGLRDIVNIVNQLTIQPCYAETWLSKPKIGNRHFDLRAISFAGLARQCVLRCTNQVLSNLHLGNQRADAAMLSTKRKMQLQSCAAQIQAAFPDSTSIAFDAIPTAEGLYVIECNAFGDLLPEVRVDGLESYDDQARWCVADRKA